MYRARASSGVPNRLNASSNREPLGPPQEAFIKPENAPVLTYAVRWSILASCEASRKGVDRPERDLQS